MSIPEEKKEPKFFLYCHLFNDSEKGVIQSVKFEIIPEVKTILDFKGKLSKIIIFFLDSLIFFIFFLLNII